MKRLLITLAIFGFALTIPTQKAHALIITSMSDPALTGATLIDFESQTNQFGLTSITIGNVEFVAVENFFNINDIFGNVFNKTGRYMENTISGFSNLTINFTNPVSAFGFNFGASDFTWSLRANLASGDVLDQTIPILLSSNAGDFFGFSAPNIVSATLSQDFPIPNLPTDYILFDNFKYVEQAGGNGVIPEPATMLLFGGGLAGAFIRKKFLG